LLSERIKRTLPLLIGSSSTDSRCLSVSLFTVSGLSGSNELRWNEEVLPGLKVVFYGEPGLGLV
jgi:hypothetical protein